MGTQLAFGFFVPIAALALAIVAVTAEIAHVQTLKDDLLLKSNIRAHTRDILFQVTAARYATRGYTLTLQPKNLEAQHAAIVTAHDDVAFVVAHEATLPAALAPQIDGLDAMVTAIDQRSTEVADLAKRDRAIVLETYMGHTSGRDAHASAVIAGNVGGFAALARTLDVILKAAGASADASAATMHDQLVLLERLLLGIGLATVLATIVVAGLLARRMTRRLSRVSGALDAIVSDDFERLSQALDRLAHGDLRVGFRSERVALADPSADEIGDLTRSYDALAAGLGAVGARLNDGTAQLRSLIGGVVTASRSLSLASDQTSSAANQASAAVEQIARAVESVAEGAKEQAHRTAQASAAVEELARSAEMIATTAAHQAGAIQDATGGLQKLDDGIASLSTHGDDLARSARDATQEAGGGNDAVTRTQATMRQLREVSQRAAEAMLALEERSQQVETIVRAIEEIAEQTNLLALNAAIEAARAGDHGRGFAVVADEVRKLAERSAGATSEISQILSAIRRETLNAAQAMRASDSSMEDGLTVAERAAAALAGVERAIETTTSVAEELASRARAMRDASLHVTENVASASAAVEENAAAAGQMRVTTHEITSTMTPVAQAAEEQSAAAQQAALATGELASGVVEIDATARALRDQAEQLDRLVARFIVDGDAPLAVPGFGALVAAG
ncbi:MAG TPA: methyl-accepting chemotaxis protein [Candidatus Sulfotelmatobacter sp.]|nr:methyl-accepting chemotaxis protein [Candidatus Sulfotelmatobacter sp.]